jgi:hypothetical protein
MVIGWPQGILVSLLLLSLGISLAKHGESRGAYSFGTVFFAVVLELFLLWWGGFFA